MRNLAEQKKIVTPLIWFFAMAIVYAVLFVVLFLGHFKVDANVFGFRMYDFTEELEKVDPYDIDEGDRMAFIAKGSKVIVKATEIADLKANDIIAFYDKVDNQTVIVTRIYKSHYEGSDGVTVYETHELDNPEYILTKIDSGRLLGVYTTSIPYLGLVSAYLTANNVILYAVLVVLALIMLVTPIIVFSLRLKARKLGSPFPEGVNINKLKTENLYIYENIREFILSSSMTIDNGYDCDLIYMGDILFGVLHVTNGHVYVNINKDFQRYDNKIDRSGYICIPHAASLETAKKRINSIYRAYFMDMKQEAMARTRSKAKRK
ncbi:MAG: hypothetical protein J6V83_04305 [Clostridia bacterium]|nr:hypothetical protein [Clostridia bacterium]MBO7156609.1 hypothetical protein [Clostridia bacterium]